MIDASLKMHSAQSIYTLGSVNTAGEGLEIAILGQIHFLVIYYLCCANSSKNCIISAVNVFERRLKETPIKDIQISL